MKNSSKKTKEPRQACQSRLRGYPCLREIGRKEPKQTCQSRLRATLVCERLVEKSLDRHAKVG